jgi:hypothetical protein
MSMLAVRIDSGRQTIEGHSGDLAQLTNWKKKGPSPFVTDTLYETDA